MDMGLVQKYADFIVKLGVAVQPRQTFIIRCPVEQAFFAHACARAGYACGAKRVIVRWQDEQLARIQYELGAEEDLCEHKPSELRSWLDYAEDPDSCCLLAIHADDPEAFSGLDAGKLNRVAMASRKFMKPWQSYTMNDRVQWCVAAVPSAAWASKIFPDLSVEAAMEKLWEVIFKVCRVNHETDPVENWRVHIERLKGYADKLNEYDLESVHFTSSNGTDLTIGLADDAVWEAAQSVSEKGYLFTANIPTEEVFTAPHRLKVNGVVYGTKPYVYNGQLIKGFRVAFKDGAVVEHSAEENGELLAELLNSDENACRIGEVALVPASSPINQSGLIFFDTLFDENAACHIAFGDGYPGTVKGGNDMTKEELLAKGVNSSAIHEDVMVGALDTDIVGLTRKGETVQIFKNGEWVL